MLFEVATGHSVAAIAVDERAGHVWAYGADTLSHFGFDGTPLGSVVLAPSIDEHAALAPNAETGTQLMKLASGIADSLLCIVSITSSGLRWLM